MTSLVASPAAAQRAARRIGFLGDGPAVRLRDEIAGFRQGLTLGGLAEPRDATVEFVWADAAPRTLDDLAQDLVARKPDALVAAGSEAAIQALLRATVTTPIVFVCAVDPVRAGFVRSMDNPGGDVTGASFAGTQVLAQQFDIFSQLLSRPEAVTALVNPEHPNAAGQMSYLIDSSKRNSVALDTINCAGPQDFAAARDAIAERRHPMLVANDGFLNGKRDALVALAARLRIPAMFGNREFVEAGGLISYGPSVVEAYQQAGLLVGRILKGENAGALPVQNPITLELAVNLQTAKALALKIPQSLLAGANVVIQ